MQITFAASECAPWARTGGLAEVISALSAELAKIGHRLRVFVPYYRQVAKLVPEPPVVLGSITIPFPSYSRFARLLDGGVRAGVQHYFVDCPEFFDRESFYATPAGDYEDNAERFGLFCRAVLEASKQVGVPDIFHVHDWQTALLPVMLRSVFYFDPVLRKIPSVLTVHNAGYQGWASPGTLQRLLLPADLYTEDRLRQANQVNLLKGGLVYADELTTVSPTYAAEVQTAEYGEGLEGVFLSRHGELTGILNGVDYDEWNPSTDPNIAAHYSAADLSGKRECRRDLLHAFGLHGIAPETMIIGIVSRFATQKGFDLIARAMPQLMERDVVLVIVGNGEEYYERLMEELAEASEGRVRVQAHFDAVLAHKVKAGADVFLMPSRYEPCGLGQIYAMRYGTVPVVRATGGLEDTVHEATEGEGNGFKFAAYDAGALLEALDRAQTMFADKERWMELMQRAMREDFSWAGPAEQYVEVYQRAIRNRS